MEGNIFFNTRLATVEDAPMPSKSTSNNHCFATVRGKTTREEKKDFEGEMKE